MNQEPVKYCVLHSGLSQNGKYMPCPSQPNNICRWVLVTTNRQGQEFINKREEQLSKKHDSNN